MAEVDIHCNVIKCRKPLSIESQACVTACSHIFCLECSKLYFSKALICPACNSTLYEERQNIILTQLNPTEEYKSSVLAGLRPEVILDIGSRAVAFYEYQSCQEINFQAMLQKSTQEKYTSLKGQFDITTRDLKHVIKVEKEKQFTLLNELELEKKKTMQLYSKYEDRSKQFQKLQVMYEKLKRKSVMPNLQKSFMHASTSGGTNQQPMMQSPNPPPSANVMRFNQPIHPQHQYDMGDDNDIIARLGRSSSVARSVFVPGASHQPPPPLSAPYSQHQTQQQHFKEPQKRMVPTTPDKSIYSVQSHHRKFYNENAVEVPPPPPPPTSSSHQAKQKSSYHHHHHHRYATGTAAARKSATIKKENQMPGGAPPSEL